MENSHLPPAFFEEVVALDLKYTEDLRLLHKLFASDEDGINEAATALLDNFHKTLHKLCRDNGYDHSEVRFFSL